jgi:uncharacterized membrane protein YphA (DoxX/SURF4 family)
VAVGLPALVQSAVYLSAHDDSTLWTLAAGVLALAIGFSLLIGFLTPFACILFGLGCAAMAFSSSNAYTQTLLYDGGLFLLLLLSMAASTALLGPGAYSLDARLFGRREIIIPQASNPHEP